MTGTHAQVVQHVLAGLLLGHLVEMKANRHLLLIADVAASTEPQISMTVTTDSGIKLRVTVEIEE